MKRSVGVTAIAVLSLIGSVCVLLMGILMFVVLVFVPPPNSRDFAASPAVGKWILAFAALIYILPAIWGIITSVGLFRLANWARISIIVFSVLMITMSAFAGLGTLLIPIPQTGGADPSVMVGIRIVMSAIWVTLLGIGVWWLLFFNRSKVKVQFSASAPSFPETVDGQMPFGLQPAIVQTPAQLRPLSFTIIAWFALVGSLFMLPFLLLHPVAILLTRIVTGWPATLFYTAFLGISLYIGIGLLRFKPLAREIAIGYYLFALLNSAIFYLAPGARERVRSLINIQNSMFPWMRLTRVNPGFTFDPTPMILLGGLAGLLLVLVPLYFLITRKQAFEIAAARAKAA
jgi:hypothetical protein